MLNQYTTPLLQNEISKNLCFVKKKEKLLCTLHQVVFSKLSSIEFKGKYKNSDFRLFVPL